MSGPLRALTGALRREGADGRAAAVAALGAGGLRPEHDGALLAVLICDTSLQVRSAAERLLADRPEERRAARPWSGRPLAEKERRALVAEHALDPAFLQVLLAYPRGRELLGGVSLDARPVDDALIALCLESGDAALVRDALGLPLDVAGRGLTFLERLGALEPDVRRAVTDALVWSALQAAAVTSADAVGRTQAACALWIEGLLLDPEGAPDLEGFLAAGGQLRRGVVAEVAPTLEPALVQAVADLARCAHLVLGPPARQPLLEPDPVAPDLESGLAELRVAARRRLLACDLTSPAEVLAAAAAEPAPGAAVELLRALPPDLGPAWFAGGLRPPTVPPARARPLGGSDPATSGSTGGPVTAANVRPFLDHPRASVREAAAGILRRSPALAALVAAGLDPGAEDAPLAVFLAQPEPLRSPALTAYLEVARPPERVVEALAALERPPALTWPGWARLLEDDAVRRAAAEALLRRPPTDGPAVAAHLPGVLAADPRQGLALIERFGLPDRHAEVEGALLRPGVSTGLATTGVAVLTRYGDARAWTILWSFVVGEPGPPPRRCGTRAGRERALDALLELPPPRLDARGRAVLPEGTTAPAWLEPPERALDEPPEAGALRRLLRERDPEQVALAVRYLAARGLPAVLRGEVTALLRDVLARADQPAWLRAWSAAWRRALRPLFGRAVAPPGPVRAGAARGPLLALLLDLALRQGGLGLWADDAEALLGRRDLPLAVREAAARLVVALLPARALPELLAGGPPELAREAVRSGPPELVESLLLARLAAASDGEGSRPDALERVVGWLELRPTAAAVPALGRLLGEAAARPAAARGLAAVHARAPGGREAVRAFLREAIRRALEERDERRLRGPLADLLEELAAWDLVGDLLPAVAWAREAARDRLVGLARTALERGEALDAAAFAPLLGHHLAEVRATALSLLRKVDPPDLWARIRPFGPGPGIELPPTEVAKPTLGVCEDHYEDAMGLVLEALLGHANGEVARRALKLINRRERFVASLALLERLDDPELRQPALTAFATWARPYLDPEGSLSSELLEDARRELRAALEGLAQGPRGRVLELLEATEGSAAPFVRAARLHGLGRLGLEERRAEVAAALEDRDPAVARAAAWAAAHLGPGADLDAPLEALTGARSRELRAEARRALARRLDLDARDALEGLLADPEPEVRLAVLDACRARPEVLAHVALEARTGDPDPRVRRAVLAALAERGRGAPRSLHGALRDALPEVRLAALECVAAWGAVEALREEVAELTADPSIHVSGRALDLVTSLAAPAEPPGGAA